MSFSGSRNAKLATSLVVGAAFFSSTGCDKAADALKDAAQDAAGISKLEAPEQATLLAEAGWDATKNKQLENFTVYGGFTLTEKFPGDLAKTVKLPVPIDIPDKAQGAAGNQRSIALLRAEKCELEPGKPVTRFRIVTVARYDGAEKSLEITGETINAAMDPAQVISLANKNQAGTYILVEGKGDKGLAYVTGTAYLAKYGDPNKVPVAGACVFTTESPFVTVSGASGKYFLAMLEGSKGMVVGSKNNIVATYSVPGTPTSATEQVKYAGVLDKYQDKYNEKIGDVGNAEVTAKSGELFTKVNTKVTDWLNGWKLIEIPITFRQPPQVAAVPPPTPQADLPVKPAPDPAPGPAPTPTPGPAPAPAPTPPADNVAPDADVVREVTPDPAFNENLGCDDPTKLIVDGSKFDTYTADVAGWRAVGDVRISANQHEKIFGAPEDVAEGSNGRYLDQFTGYCVLSTGDSQFQEGGAANPIFQPIEDMQSEMWQKLKIPAAASGIKAIQLRVAFFSQEFPKFVGTQYNDSFYVKFDEHLDVIGDGNLNEIAGINDPAFAAEVNGCSAQVGGNVKCGDWQSVKTLGLHGEMWSVDKDSQATSKSMTYECQNPDTKNSKLADGKVKCYHGWVPPRTFCKNLAPEDFGTEKTLRIGITDVGDQYFTSAIAIDSVVFTKADCAGDAGFAADPDSRASEL